MLSRSISPSVFWAFPYQHNGTYTRNVYPATPTKKPAQILRFAESENEPLSRKILGKAAQNALGKGTGPSNLPDTAVGIFLSRLKKWAQKSPEVVETSRLFAAASFLVQLDGGPEETRTLDLSDANRTLSRTVHNYAPKQGIFIVKISKITGNQCVCPFSYKTLFPLPVSVRECLLYFQGAFGDVTQMAGK